jgi:hypothetical protein
MEVVLDKKTHLINILIQLYSTNFGSLSARLYQEFYKDKDMDTILASSEELLTEMLGEAKAKDTMTSIRLQI